MTRLTPTVGVQHQLGLGCIYTEFRLYFCGIFYYIEGCYALPLIISKVHTPLRKIQPKFCYKYCANRGYTPHLTPTPHTNACGCCSTHKARGAHATHATPRRLQCSSRKRNSCQAPESSQAGIQSVKKLPFTANLNNSKMDFAEQTPEEKLKLGQVLSGAAKIIPAVAPFVPALQPVAAVIGALKK